MPTISRAKRQKARQKRTNSLLKRQARALATTLQQAGQQANQSFATLALVLSHLGGEVSIPKAVIEDVQPRMRDLQYAVQPTEDGVRVYLSTVKADGVVDAASLPAESLEEMKDRMQRAHNGEVPALPSAGSVTEQLRRDREARQAFDADTFDADIVPVDPTIAAGDPA